jgi:outer membrane protein insertion porin family
MKLPILILAAAVLSAQVFSADVEAQTSTPAQQPPPKPRPGQILERPDAGRITSPEPAAPAAPGALAGQRIERFEASGNATVASDTIRVYLGVNVGETYDPALLQRNFLNLWQTGLFDDIRIETDKGDNGIVLRVIVKERPRIGSVEYRGNKDLQTNKITEQLEKDKIDLHIGTTIEQTLVKRAAESIKKAYSENGYEGVNVDVLQEDLAQPGEKKIVFSINEGIKATVAQVQFTGNRRFSSRRLRLQMKEVQPNNIISWIRKKNLYIPSKLDEDLEHVKNYYQDYGYYDVSFGDPQITTVRSGKKPRVKIVIPIKEGNVQHFGEVSVTGNVVLKNDLIIGDWPLKKGEVLKRKALQARLDMLNDYYHSRGYMYAYVNPEYVKSGKDVMDIKIQVYEGDQFRLGRLEFQGNTTTKDKVLRREIFIQEGDVMDMETFKQSIYKLGQLGYYKVNDNPDLKVNNEKKLVDVVIKGNEEGKNDVQFGGGYSEGGGFFVQTQFSTRNFLGEGENLGLSFQRGNRQNYFSLSYSDPWFLDTPNSLGMSVFDRNTHYPQSVGFEERSKGGSLVYGYRLHRFDSISFAYGIEHLKQHTESTPVPDENGNIPITEITDAQFSLSSIAPSYSYDSRDNPFDPTRGARVSLSLAYSGGPLGGNVHSIKPIVGLTKFFRISRRTTLSINTDLGYLLPLDKDCSNNADEQAIRKDALCIPKSQRFFVGGEYSVRGFKYATLGPKESYFGTQVEAGGYKQFVANAEYITKLNDPLRLVFFVDSGWAFGNKDKIDVAQLRYSGGAELRIFLPVFQFPIRFIYAFNLRPKAGDEFESLQFTIGNTF